MTVLETFHKHNGTRNILFVKCLCICGNTCEVRKQDFYSIKKVSCGCLKNSLISQQNIKEIPKGTKFGYLTVVKRIEERSTEGYKYECLCDCGTTISVYYNRLKREETKSCGCSSLKLNSLNNGGTGIPYETIKLQRAIRACPRYRNFVKKALIRSGGKSELSGDTDEKLCVHHKTSVSALIEKHQLTIGTFMTCKDLFSLDNAIVLTEQEHRDYHAVSGHKCIMTDWETYSKAVIK
jgi:hypothetical protein